MPETIELKMSPMTSGSAANPEFVGVNDWTTWNQRGRNTIAPKKANAAKKVETIEAEYVRLRHRSSGTIGSLARASARMNSSVTMMPMKMNPPTVGSVHALSVCVDGLYKPLLVRKTSRKIIEIVKITPPTMSKFRVADAVLTVGRSRW